MSEQSYKVILRNTSIFGGVQLFQVIISLIKAKVIAIFLGSVGMGISGLLFNAQTLIISIANLGLNYSGVRAISEAKENNVANKLWRVATVFIKLTTLTGILGFIGTIAFSSFLSKSTFGNYNFSYAFVWLSIVVFFNILTTGFSTIFQALGEIKYLVKSSIIGSLFALIVTIPLYIMYKIEGIVPAIILSSLITLVTNYFFIRRILKFEHGISIFKAVNEGKEMFKLGITMMVSVFFGAFATLFVNSFISNSGGLSDVGLYQAGMSITNQFVGLIFAAMAMDYLPRLSAVASNMTKVNEMVNQQGEIMILIISPLLMLIILSAPLIVRILLSNDFLPIVPFVRIVAIGILFKAAVYSVGYISFAKGDKWFYLFVDAVSGNIIMIVLNIIFYNNYGFNGLAISFVLIYLLGLAQILYLTRIRYNFSYKKQFYKIFCIMLITLTTAVILLIYLYSIYTLIICCFIFVFNVYYSYREIDKRVGVGNLLKMTKQ
jgi:O-antigen/teichoic acid export membrane protein